MKAPNGRGGISDAISEFTNSIRYCNTLDNSASESTPDLSPARGFPRLSDLIKKKIDPEVSIHVFPGRY